ncbi:MAG: hypothetical protein JWN72_1723 [Thermoleophilia bacterium]|nr:hypothetical protein [Thermoleophilia bacterium]
MGINPASVKVMSGVGAAVGVGIGTALSFPAHAAARKELDAAQADWDAHPDDHARSNRAANDSVDQIAAHFGKGQLVQEQADGTHYLSVLDADGSFAAYAKEHAAAQVYVSHDQYGDETTVRAYPATFHHETSAASKIMFAPIIAGGVLAIGGFIGSTVAAARQSPAVLAASAGVGLLGAGLLASSFFGSISAPGAPQPYL